MDAILVVVIQIAYHVVLITMFLEVVVCCARMQLLDARYVQTPPHALGARVDIILMVVVVINVRLFKHARYVLIVQPA